ncbi:MAG TPA: hypothetical protein VFD92_02460 [Candidatus Binatia bacterium]|nr:hypothetical protein [Candidatus Binatia bacterium]
MTTMLISSLPEAAISFDFSFGVALVAAIVAAAAMVAFGQLGHRLLAGATDRAPALRPATSH